MSYAAKHPEPDVPAMEADDYIGISAGAAIYTRTLRDVILPGLTECGVDARGLTRWARERGWV